MAPRLWPHIVVFIVQFLLVAITLPLSELWSEKPLFHIDAAYHWYNMKLAANLVATMNLVGYDPFFSAGDVSGIFNGSSGKVPALLAVLFSPSIDEIRLYKLYVLAASVLAPLAISIAAATLRLTSLEVLAAAGMGILMWWVSYLHWYSTAGLVAYAASCYFGVLFAVLVIRCLEGSGSKWAVIGLGLFGAVGFFWHPLFPIPVAVVTCVYVAINYRQLSLSRSLTVLTVVPVLSVLPNLIWLYPTYSYYDGHPGESHLQALVDASLIWRELLGKLDIAHGSKVYPLLVVASLWACLRPGRADSRRLWLAFLFAAISLQLLAYLGAAVPAVATLEPNRFAVAGYLLLCLPAARGLTALASVCVRPGYGPWRAFAGVNIAAVVLVGTVLTWELWREVTPGVQGRYGAPPPQIRDLGEDSLWVIDSLKRRANADSRVLFETALGRVHDQAHMAGYYAYQTQQEFIGGPYPFQHFASFWDGRAFGKPISDIATERMADYFSLYNIGAIIAYSAAAKRYFDAMPGVQAKRDYGVLRLYTVEGDQSYFLRGAGRVKERGHNHLLITDIVGSEIVLKYHYVPGIVTEPAMHLDSVRMLDDPKPFIRIVDPPPTLRIHLPPNLPAALTERFTKVDESTMQK